MKKIIALLIVIINITSYSFGQSVSKNYSPGEHLSLDDNWKFHLGDEWPDALGLKKAGENGGPASVKFNDNAWRTVTVPHDWAIELPFEKTSDKNRGYKPIGFKSPSTSIGWYRRTFELPVTDSGKSFWLQFDGVFRDARVWVNGWIVTHHEGGYYPFRVDITDIVQFGGKNTIAVRVDASNMEGWFYEGAGIYRHVWLDKTEPLAIATDGVFVYTQFKNNQPVGKPSVKVEVQLLNKESTSSKATVKCEVIAPNGTSVAKFNATDIVNGNTEKKVPLSSVIPSPILWSPETPNLYKLITTIEQEGKVVDQKETRFGIRTIAFDKDKGFFLNGKHYWLYGTCNHQDHAGVGAALPDALQYFRIKKLKEFSNAYRTSHNPPTPELLDACDSLGMIVMDENRLLGSDEENMRRWETQIRRDRNHPSVCIWSICNEEHMQASSAAGRVGATMQALVKRIDPTRPVTAAENIGNVYTGLMGTLEVRGWNYHTYGMDDYHAAHPEQVSVGTEETSAMVDRGIYEKDTIRKYVAGYSSCANPKNWPFFAERPWISGVFIWTGFDYRGEPSPYNWPCISSHFGVIDVCGFPKDNMYYYKSWWTKDTVLHILPHWNWVGKEGKNISVIAYSNCEEVELFLNDQSLGKQTMKINSQLSWNVKYAPGKLTAKGFISGKVVKEEIIETTDEPASVLLIPDRSVINANGEDVSVFTVEVVDAQGRVVHTANNKINFEINGTGKIIGVGNGDPSCLEPDTYLSGGWSRSIFNGLAQIIVQSTKEAGEIKLTATSQGLQSATSIIKTQASVLRASIQ